MIAVFHATLRRLATNRIRSAMTAVAVVLGIAFVSGTMVLTDTMRLGFDDLLADVNASTDLVVRGTSPFSSADAMTPRPRVDAGLVAKIERIEGVADADVVVRGFAQLVTSDGRPVEAAGMGAATLGANWITNSALNPFRLAEGSPPSADDEVVIDRGTAKRAGLGVGDAARAVTATGTRSVNVVGVATFGTADSPGGTAMVLFAPATADRLLGLTGVADSISVEVQPGVDVDELASRIGSVLPDGVEVLTGSDVTAESQDQAADGLASLGQFLLAFGVIGLFVGSFMIYNTFSILVAQRRRETALLRALGASRRQVLGSVLAEAALIGITASFVGLGLGVATARGLISLFRGLNLDLPNAGLVVAGSTVWTAIIIGSTVSIAAALIPARAAASVAPVAAMREVDVDRSGRDRRRSLCALAFTGVAAAALTAGVAGDGGLAASGFGAALLVAAVVVGGPWLARPVVHGLGWPLHRAKGVTGHLARSNALRNPRRTSTTAAALMIGVALVVAVSVLASSMKASVATAIETSFTGDFVVTTDEMTGATLDAGSVESLRDVDTVAAVVPVRATSIEVDDSMTRLTGVDPTALNAVIDLGVVDGSLEHLDSDGIALHTSLADAQRLVVGDTLTVTTADAGALDLVVGAVYSRADLLGDLVVSTALFDEHVGVPGVVRALIALDAGADVAAAEVELREALVGQPQAQLYDREGLQSAQAQGIDAMLNLVTVLLALAVIIAVLGIANTIALSVYERTAEIGLLRAIGAARRQIRAIIRWESVIIASFGAVTGTAVGLVCGWVFTHSMSGIVMTGRFDVPGDRVASVIVLAAIAGALAAIVPARRAARLDVLDAIAER